MLTRVEQNLAKTNECLSIPEGISNVDLKKLLHKQAKRVNKWIKNSLRGTTKLEFEPFMQRDKSFVDKNSL